MCKFDKYLVEVLLPLIFPFRIWILRSWNYLFGNLSIRRISYDDVKSVAS